MLAAGGKYYAEFYNDPASSADFVGFGICLGTATNDGGFGPDLFAGITYDNVKDTNYQQRGYYFGGSAPGNVLRVAVDFDNGVFFVRMNEDGYGWNAFGDNPTGDNPDQPDNGATMNWTDPVYVCALLGNAGQIVHYRSEASEFTYPIPTGYQPWGAASSEPNPDPQPAVRLRRSVHWF